MLWRAKNKRMDAIERNAFFLLSHAKKIKTKRILTAYRLYKTEKNEVTK